MPTPPPHALETAKAVRLVFALMAGAMAVYLLTASIVTLDGPFVRAGRERGASWIAWKTNHVRELDRLGELRSHPGGQIAWLLGGSVLREAFDEGSINRDLAELGSPFRVVKMAQNIGGPGFSPGVLRRLPVEPGDLVFQALNVEYFRRDILRYHRVPPAELDIFLDDAARWSIAEWTWREKLELAVAWPRDFFRFHDDHVRGVLCLLKAPWNGIPEPRRRSHHLETYVGGRSAALQRARQAGTTAGVAMPPGSFDSSREQFHVHGLRRLEKTCAELGAGLVLLEIPPRAEYMARFVAPDVHTAWEHFKGGLAGLERLPRSREGDYFDLKHPNARGRERYSAALVAVVRRASGG